MEQFQLGPLVESALLSKTLYDNNSKVETALQFLQQQYGSGKIPSKYIDSSGSIDCISCRLVIPIM